MKTFLIIYILDPFSFMWFRFSEKTVTGSFQSHIKFLLFGLMVGQAVCSQWCNQRCGFSPIWGSSAEYTCSPIVLMLELGLEPNVLSVQFYSLLSVVFKALKTTLRLIIGKLILCRCFSAFKLPKSLALSPNEQFHYS